MTIRPTAKYQHYDTSEQLIGELIEAFEAIPELEAEQAPSDIEILAENDDNFVTDSEVDAVAAALACAYKAGVQAGQINGVPLTQHDAADDDFWHEKALSLLHNLRVNERHYQ